jgi:hypothetical protein
MFWQIVRRRGVIPLVLILAALAYWKLHPSAPKTIEVGYVGDRTVTLWNTLAQVRQPVAELHYGNRVEVVREEGTSAQVRTGSGVLGWLLDSRQMMDSDLWEQSTALLAQARTKPVQARGQTKTVSNLRVKPGRDAKRIYQLMRGTPVIVLERAVADVPQTSDENSSEEKKAIADDPKPQREDWLLVLRDEGRASSGEPLSTSSAGNLAAPVNRASGDPVSGSARSAQSEPTLLGSPTGPIAGWVLARFIEPNLPGPVRDYASSADLHVVAWFELNRVPDGSGGDAPQYLVAGSRGSEGQACDFTMLRVYTWGAARKRYETAYVESDLCGRLPIRVSNGAAGPEFRFADLDTSSAERMYVMQQTSVRRVKDKSSEKPKAQSKSRKK